MPKLSAKTQAARRAHILDAAERCFVRAGFHRATMADICRQAGVSAGALYVYFRSKEELIEGLSQRDRAEVRQAFADAAAGTDLVHGLAQVLECCVLGAPADKARLQIEIGAEATRNPAVAATLSACEGDIRGALVETLRQAQTRGQIRPALPIPELARLISVVVDGLFWRRALDPAFDSAAMAPHILKMFGALMGLDPEDLAALLSPRNPLTNEAAR